MSNDTVTTVSTPLHDLRIGDVFLTSKYGPVRIERFNRVNMKCLMETGDYLICRMEENKHYKKLVGYNWVDPFAGKKADWEIGDRVKLTGNASKRMLAMTFVIQEKRGMKYKATVENDDFGSYLLVPGTAFTAA